jgi:hypothetical protein
MSDDREAGAPGRPDDDRPLDDEDEVEATWLPDPADEVPDEADSADWIDQQRAVPPDDERER